MANMNFGVNILPKANNTYTLGNSDYKWNIFANTLNGQTILSDVQVNSTSIVNNGIASIPIATENDFSGYRLVQINASNGINIASDNCLSIVRAVESDAKSGSNAYKVCTPYWQHYYTFYGLAKAAGDSTQAASSNSVGNYTNEAKAAIRNMLGISSTGPTITDIQINNTSILNNTVATIPIATSNTLGVVKGGFGTTIDANGNLNVNITDVGGFGDYDKACSMDSITSITSWMDAAAGKLIDDYELPDPTIMENYKIGTNGDLVANSDYNTYVFEIPTNDNPLFIIYSQSDTIGYQLAQYTSSTLSAENAFIVVDRTKYIQIEKYPTVTHVAFSCEKGLLEEEQLYFYTIKSIGVSFYDHASTSAYGVVKVGNGLAVNTSSGGLQINSAGTGVVKEGTSAYFPIVPGHQHESVFYGLAKAAGDSTQASSSNAVGTYTDTALGKIQDMLHIADSGIVPTIKTTTVTIDSLTDSWALTAKKGYYHVDGGDATGTFLEGVSSSYGLLEILGSRKDDSTATEYLTARYYNATGKAYFRSFYRTTSSSTLAWRTGLQEIVTSAFTGATSLAAGAAGLVPAPAQYDNTKYLRGDGTWSNVNATSWSGYQFNGLETQMLATDGYLIYCTNSKEYFKTIQASTTPAAGKIAIYGTSGYLNSTTPTANDNSTKVATTAYVDSALANFSSGISGVKLISTSLTPDANGIVTIPAMAGATSSVAGSTGLVPAPTTSDTDKFLAGDGTWKDGGKPMVILSYGSSTWAEFEAAYNNNVIVYCRASPNSNPASGSQTRMAFMAYVNNATTPTIVEFQYYRSVNSHSATQMGDQVFVYKLDKTSGWSVTTREASIKEINVASGSKLGVSWSSNKVTLSNTMTANDMPMSSSDATTTKSAIDTLNSKIGTDIIGEGNITANTSDGWAVELGSCAGKVYKYRNGFFTIDLVMVPTEDKTINAWSVITIATIPEGYRPAVEIHVPLLIERGDPINGFYTLVNATIKTNGIIELQTRFSKLSLIGNGGTFLRLNQYCYM